MCLSKASYWMTQSITILISRRQYSWIPPRGLFFLTWHTKSTMRDTTRWVMSTRRKLKLKVPRSSNPLCWLRVNKTKIMNEHKKQRWILTRVNKTKIMNEHKKQRWILTSLTTHNSMSDKYDSVIAVNDILYKHVIEHPSLRMRCVKQARGSIRIS